MALPELNIGDLVVVQIAGQQLVILVEVLMSAGNIFMVEGYTLATTPMLAPDFAPNALDTIQLCGPAQVFKPGTEIDIGNFKGTRLCIDVNDIMQHIPRKQ